MTLPDFELRFWGWFFWSAFAVVMLASALVGIRRVRNSDDFATARGSYGPLILSFAVVATTASGVTFLGIPGIAYREGISGLWYAFVYPFGVYTGIVLCARIVSRAGEQFGSRTIPEYLGDRYDSDFLRVASSVYSLLLLFYLAAQLLAGSVMFQQIFGVPELMALLITSGFLLLYIPLGGAHADILTDGVQGILMFAIALVVIAMFFSGFGVEGGFPGMLDRLRQADNAIMVPVNPNSTVAGSLFAIFAIWFSHIPLGMLPHIGNKIWALKSQSSRKQFLTITFVLGTIMPALALGGLLARAVVGDELLGPGETPNNAIPMLFVLLLPSWLAALLGAGVLAAVMSTADGLVVSGSQIFANDIYRRTICGNMKTGSVDSVALTISRVTAAIILIISTAMAWRMREFNIAIIVWLGVGGLTAAFTGPLILGAIWSGVTRTAAIAGFVSGASVFAITSLIAFLTANDHLAANWASGQLSNPFIRATVGGLISLCVSAAVSLFSERLPPAHLERLFERRL